MRKNYYSFPLGLRGSVVNPISRLLLPFTELIHTKDSTGGKRKAPVNV